MENDSLTISLPRPMKSFIREKLQEGRYSTPSEYIRSLIRSDQEREEATRGFNPESLTDNDWSVIETLVRQRGERASTRRSKVRK